MLDTPPSLQKKVAGKNYRGCKVNVFPAFSKQQKHIASKNLHVIVKKFWVKVYFTDLYYLEESGSLVQKIYLEPKMTYLWTQKNVFVGLKNHSREGTQLTTPSFRGLEPLFFHSWYQIWLNPLLNPFCSGSAVYAC